MSNSNKNSRRNRMEMLIYKITNIKNKEIYVGKCKNLQKRWQQHRSSSKNKKTWLYDAMRTYGLENFSIQILEKCYVSNVNRREKFWIAKLQPIYNMTKGGDGGGFLNKKHKDHWFKTIKKNNSKPVACYDISGNLVETFSSHTEAGKFINKTHKGISACIRGEYKTCGGFQWKSLKNKNSVPSKIAKYVRKSHKNRKVLQYSLDQKLIRQYSSITEAARITKSSVPKIVLVCQKKRKTHNNFVWQYI